MAIANHIFCYRIGYTHHGIDLGDGTVIHYTGEPGQQANAAVCRTPIDHFMRGCELHVQPYGTCDPPEVVIERAHSRLGESKYDLVFNNCEHFAVWCKTGTARSPQVKDVAASTGGTVGAGTAVAASVGAVSAAGAVAGLSGPGIMSGLATLGAVAGGGAVAGIVVLGAAPAVVTTGAMLFVLGDDPALPQSERGARRVGQVATVAGAVGGSAASVGAITAVGVAGVAGPGITSALAGIGAVVGGGMAAGVVLTVAAPAVGAAVVGYGSYRLWKGYRSSQPDAVAGERVERALAGSREELTARALSVAEGAGSAIRGAAANAGDAIGIGANRASVAIGKLADGAASSVGSLFHRDQYTSASHDDLDAESAESRPESPDAQDAAAS